MEEVGGSTPPGDVVRLALRVASLPPHLSIEKLLDTANDEFERLALTKVEHVWTGHGKEEFFNVLRQLGATDNDPVWQEAESILFRARRGAEKSAVPAAPQVAQGALPTASAPIPTLDPNRTPPPPPPPSTSG